MLLREIGHKFTQKAEKGDPKPKICTTHNKITEPGTKCHKNAILLNHQPHASYLYDYSQVIFYSHGPITHATDEEQQ